MISDNKSIVFNVKLALERKKLKTSATYSSRAINAEVVHTFSENVCVLTDGWAYDATTVDQLNQGFSTFCKLGPQSWFIAFSKWATEIE